MSILGLENLTQADCPKWDNDLMGHPRYGYNLASDMCLDAHGADVGEPQLDYCPTCPECGSMACKPNYRPAINEEGDVIRVGYDCSVCGEDFDYLAPDVEEDEKFYTNWGNSIGFFAIDFATGMKTDIAQYWKG